MKIFFIFLFIYSLSTTVKSFENKKIPINDFFIQKYEVTIKEFQSYA